ncbi:transposase [Rubellimicrobium rubrum]|uniref:Transposase n=2 Tax=Rubellimicrobium rubrum TaxID=2585369 RepID=A0A5C4MV10_9RHOB|nr:transposase [Rubellimicrobium rubrum]
MPRAGLRGAGRWRDHGQLIRGLMWKLWACAPWRDLPERHGPRQTSWERFSWWRHKGLFDRLPDRLPPKLNTAGLTTWTSGASHLPRGQPLGRRCAGRRCPRRPRAPCPRPRAQGSRPPSTKAAMWGNPGRAPWTLISTAGATQPNAASDR